MNKRLKWAFVAFIVMGLISIIPGRSYAETAGNTYYIKNNYTQGAYLYEANGVLRYGIPMEGDQSFEWVVEEKDSYKTIKNVATNDYITLEGHGDDTVEGNWGEPIHCTSLADNKDSFLWEFELGEGQNILSASKSYEGFVLHLENATAGQPFAQKVSGDQLTWGNMKWDFVSPDQVDPAAMTSGGFCIQNADDGTYLRVDNGILTHGKPDGPDDAYIWEIEQRPDGTKAIKNKKTSQYITMENYDAAMQTIGLGDNSKDNESAWSFQLSKYETLLSADSGYDGYGLYLDAASKNKARCRDILSKGDELTDGMKWNFIPTSNVPEVAGDLVLEEGIYNLKNSWFSMYLIEDNGKAVYGNAKPSDANAQWQFTYDKATGLTALKNVGSGNYLYAKSDTGELVFSSSLTPYWKLKRHLNADYPKAVIFQDSVKATNYLHMESLNGFAEDSNAVQPTWGTPHWEPIKYTEAASSQNAVLTVPTDFIRLYSSVKEGQYLYENSSGAVVYKKCDASDAKSHWKLVPGEEKGVYYLQNRDTEDYVTNKGNGTLRCLPKDQAITQGSLWEVSAGNAQNKLMLNNYYPDVKPYQRPYLNIQKDSGFAQSNLVSIEDEAAQWIYENAQAETTALEEKEEVAAVPLHAFIDTNVYKLLYNNEYLDGLYQLEYYGNFVRILDIKENKYLYYENGWSRKASGDMTDKILQWDSLSKAGVTYLKNGDTKLQLEISASDAYYDAEKAYISGDKLIFTVNADRSDTYQINFKYDGKKLPVTLEVNGTTKGSIDLPSKDGMKLPLNKGINTIALKGGPGVEGITVVGSSSQNYRGATLAYTQYQAEDCNTTGTILDESRTYHEITSEASGRLAVSLDGTGKYIKITLLKPANSLVIRYCIPDSQDGTGMDATLNLYIDGKKNQSMNLTSRYSWVYGAYPWTNNPAEGQAHHFFDETSILLDKTYPAGTVIKLQKDSANHAEYYVIDEVDAEEIPSANARPENSLSITDFGAIAGDGKDDSKALYDCMKAAVEQGKEIWIPEGVFDITTPTSDYDKGDQQDKNRGIIITDDNVVIRGAGMWYSVLQGEFAALFIKASNISLYDFALRGDATARRDAIDPSAIESDYNTPEMKNLTIQNLWIEHYKTGIWTHNMDGMHIVGCRIRDTFADGMNLRKGSSNAVVEQCDVRNTGDDAIALWSSMASDTNVKIRFNTVGLQWLANNIAVYGGTDIEVTDNLLYDTVVNGAGINISSNFDPKPFAGTITVARNTLYRCGSQDSNNNQNDGAIWFNTVQGNDNNAAVIVSDNLILNSTFQGISFSNRGKISNVVLEYNAIIGSGSYGIDVLKGAKGSVKATNNLIQDMMLEAVNNSSTNAFELTQETKAIQETMQPQPQTEQTGRKDTLPMAIAAVIIAVGAGCLLWIFWIRKRKKN